MPRSDKPEGYVEDFRHEESRRKNNPPAGIAPTYEPKIKEREATKYSYDPHLDPQLLWSGKAEQLSFEVDVVSLHIHERISTRAILEAVSKPEPQLQLFGETPLPLDQQIEFYKHDVNWANRLILGDSLLVMNSLLVKEGIAGKVQMIYVDPPYGIKFSSNFQPRIDRRDVKDRDEDLTHEPEQIKAYRDTWKLGIHSYLTYLRDRLLLCRELLSESGSIFVQINDENLHLVRCLLDEIFGRENFVAVIAFRTHSPLGVKFLPSLYDYLLWYAKDKSLLKFRPIFVEKQVGEDTQFIFVELLDSTRRRFLATEIAEPRSMHRGAKVFRLVNLPSSGYSASCTFDVEFQGKIYKPSRGRSWKTNREGMYRLISSDRVASTGSYLNFVYYWEDFPLMQIPNVWSDTYTELDKRYSVQTAEKVIERCILMTTDPGDLVFDPTCGSGTTAYCAEKWGRRWITCDTSRVALAIARQRLMTAKFDYFELLDPERGPSGGFVYETVPHITLESIAKNSEIDTIAEKYQPKIESALARLNKALNKDWKEWEVPIAIPHPVWSERAKEAYRKLYNLKKEGKVFIKKDKAKELLDIIYNETGHLWDENDIPDPIPAEEWSEEAKKVFYQFWELKIQKKNEIEESIQRNAHLEILYDRPKIKKGIVRVTGPFTVEAIPVPSIEVPSEAEIPQFEEEEARRRINDRGGDYLTNMINLLKQQGGVIFPGGKKLELQNIRPLNRGLLHVEAEAVQNGKTLRVAISFGPLYGPVTAFQAQEAVQLAKVGAYDILILAGFSIDGEAQALVQKISQVIKEMSVHFANISPDVLVGDLLKTTRASQIFTVFGEPDVVVEKKKDGTYIVELRGVDIYDPLTGEVKSIPGEDVAAWFLDTDYDGMTFHICQAYFPGDEDAWEKLQRALKAWIDPEAFDKMRGTISFPFKPGAHKRIAVKVIDFRGNEVMRIVNLLEEGERPAY